MARKLLFKRGGVHPPESKELCDASTYTIMPTPQSVTVPLSMHLGAPARAVVANRDAVEAGQLIAKSGGFVSANIHTPLAGKVRQLNKVYLGPVASVGVTIAVEGQAGVPDYEPEAPELDLEPWEATAIIERIAACGLVGMGGASFPTHVKLSPPPGSKIDTIVINGAECEPYLTADDCLMRNRPRQIVQGTRAMIKACGVAKAWIGVEANKPEAFQSLTDAARGYNNIEIVMLRTQYPQGAEKQLIEATTGRRVPPGKLPFAVGVVVQNVATTAAIYEALQFSRPLTRRLLTVSGRAVARPQNVLVPVGTAISEIIDYCGGPVGEVGAVILGGPMMGRATTDLTEPVTKGTSGILLLAREEIQDFEEQPCIRCGTCVSVCPMGLVPTELAAFSRRERFESARDALDCIECGCCSYICPSNIRLVHWIRLAKWELGRMQKREQLRRQQEEREAEEKRKALEAIKTLPR